MQIRQLFSEPSFIHWAKRTNPEDFAYWEDFKKRNPQYNDLMEEARLMINGISIEKSYPHKSAKEKTWLSIENQIRETDIKRFEKKRPIARILLSIAAGVVLLLGAWFLFHLVNPGELITLRTGFGETKELVLPDGSKVWLNANSSLEYPENLSRVKNRMIKLAGEAYFEVQAMDTKNRFIVQTDQIQVTVLGTSFNIYTREKEEVVSLVEGRLQIDQKISGNRQFLKPGETVIANQMNHSLNKISENIAARLSWRHGKWTFNQTSLRDISQKIEEEFGFKVIVEDRQLLERKISGQVKTDKREVLIKALGELLSVNIVESGNNLLLSKR